MSLIPKIVPRLWIATLVCACGFLAWTSTARLQRVGYISGLAGRAAPVDVANAGSRTGYADGQRELIVPERDENSFNWIAQTQQMFARGEWRVRHVDYDNAPFGREVNSPSPYRWWLGVVAWLDHAASGRPIGLAVERAALFADPLLSLLFAVGMTIFVAWRFGALPAALFSAGAATLFPFAAGFLPGVPDAHGLASLCALGSIVVLLPGMNSLRVEAGRGTGEAADQSIHRWFVLAGIVGGLGMWVSVAVEVPVVVGISLGALVSAWIVRRGNPGDQPGRKVAVPWRTWAASGGVTILVTYLIEYFPDHLGSWRLDSIHPLYGLAWIGGGELLARTVAWIQREKCGRGLRDVIGVGFAFIAVATIPAAMWLTGSRGFLAQDLLWPRLTNLPNGVVAASVKAWLIRDGATPAFWATVLPLLTLFPAGWLMLRRATKQQSRISIAIAAGPVLVILGFAGQQLSWWMVLDGALLVLLVAAGHAAAGHRTSRWIVSAAAILMAALGITQLWPERPAGAELKLTSSESGELIERHLAHWLAKRAGQEGAVVYAPPQETATLCFYGGLRGIGTFGPDNRAGFGSALMIAGVTTMEEAQALLLGHGVRYIVVPSWDPFFDNFAQLYLAKNFSNRTSLLIRELRRWNLPRWLRPMPYQMPVSGGFEGQSALVFEVVDEQSPVVAASRTAEYLVEIGELAQAADAGEALRRYPGDIGALSAQAQVQNARGDSAGLAQTMDSLISRLSSGTDRYLPWDRRVSLAMVLARGNRVDLAREQVKRCLAEADEARLRSLSTGSLYGLEVLGKAFGLEMADQRLNKLALELLPGDLRTHL